MHKLFFILLLLPIIGLSQQKITWETLEDVHLTDRYSEDEKAYYYYPHFGFALKELQGKEVYIKGYMLPIEPKEDLFILSRNPFAACFFCGASGPESIVELKLKPDHPKFKMDQIVTIKGRLILNAEDLYQCIYIMEDAEVYKP